MARIKDYIAHLFAHTISGNHVTGDGGSLLQVAARASGHIPQYQLLGNPAAQADGNPLGEILPGLERHVLLGHGDSHSPRHTSRNNRNLVHRILRRQAVNHDGMARLVIGCEPAFPLDDHPALLLRSGDDLDHRVVQIPHGDKTLVPAGGQQSRFVHQIFQVGAGKAASGLCQLPEGHILCQGFVPGVDLQDLFPALDVGPSHVDLTVKPSGTQQRGIQDILPVGGRHHHCFQNRPSQPAADSGSVPAHHDRRQGRLPADGPQRQSHR